MSAAASVVFALAGIGLLLAGIYLLFGVGWTLVVGAGIALYLGYSAYEMSQAAK